jgi:hypothetical protein
VTRRLWSGTDPGSIPGGESGFAHNKFCSCHDRRDHAHRVRPTTFWRLQPVCVEATRGALALATRLKRVMGHIMAPTTSCALIPIVPISCAYPAARVPPTDAAHVVERACMTCYVKSATVAKMTGHGSATQDIKPPAHPAALTPHPSAQRPPARHTMLFHTRSCAIAPQTGDYPKALICRVGPPRHRDASRAGVPRR